MAEPAEGSPTANPHDLVLRYLRTAFTAVKSAFGPDFPCTGAGHGDMAYGEITYRGMGQLYPALRLGPGDVAYDLGSGAGKLVLYLALRGAVQRAAGIELGERRH